MIVAGAGSQTSQQPDQGPPCPPPPRSVTGRKLRAMLGRSDLSVKAIPRGGVPGPVEKEKWRILPVGEVHDQPAAVAGGHRRNAPWERVASSLGFFGAGVAGTYEVSTVPTIGSLGSVQQSPEHPL